jgi:hypothetical protein
MKALISKLWMGIINTAVEFLKFSFEILISIILTGLVFLMGASWIYNIVKLCTLHEALGMTIARAVGILMWPIGIVLGFF